MTVWRPFRIAPATIRVGTKAPKGYQRAGFGLTSRSRSTLVADHSIAEHSRAMDHNIGGAEHRRAMDHSIAGTARSIAGTEPGTPGMVRREGSRVSSRHVLVSPPSPPQRSSLRQSEAFS